MNGWSERLGQGEKVASASALVLFACMFLSWFNFGFETENAWEALHFISSILFLTIVASLGVALMKVTDRDLGDIPGGLVILVLGALSVVLILFRLIDPVSTPGFEGGSTSASVEAGAFLGLIAAAGVAVGGYLATDSEALEKLKRLIPSGGAAGAAFPAPPAPPAPPPPPAEAAPAPPSPAPPVEAAPARTPLPPVTPPPPKVEPIVPPPPSPPEDEPLTETLGSTEEAKVFCESCGSPVRPTDRFCGKCGQQQTTAAGA